MKKAMKNPSLTAASANSRVIEFPSISETNQREQDIETRLRDLSALVADLTDSGYGVLLSEEPTTREAFDELRVKEAALRWIIRVARHTTGTVREKLWSDVEEAVSGLESTAELLLHSRLVWTHPSASNHPIKMAGPGRF